MPAEQPLWLRTVLRAERAMGAPVEAAVRSDTYFDLLAGVHRTGARLFGLAETMSQEWLHLWNLPAGSDVRRLREQLARVERRLGEIAKELEDRETSQNGSGNRAE